MIVRPARDDDVRYVTAHLREHCRREVFACRNHDSPEALAAEILALNPMAIAHYALLAPDGNPAALVGAWLVSPARAAVGVMSTDQWLTIGRSAYRFFKRQFIPFVFEPSLRVAETAVLVGPDRAWLYRLGFVDCLPAIPRGKNGERFVTMFWQNPAAPNV